MSSGNWQPFCLGLNVLNAAFIEDGLCDSIAPQRPEIYSLFVYLHSEVAWSMACDISSAIFNQGCGIFFMKYTSFC